jgi:DNA invertase Pin-like site-specific DNA recombinase
MVGAVIYVRVSTKEQTENLSLPTQLRACEEYCRRQGYEILERFHEEGESAKTTDRSQLQGLLTYCRLNKGRVHFVVVFNLTRFARDKHDHFALRSLLQSLGISLRSATEPIDDTSTGKLMEGVLAAFAQFDNDCRSDRTRAGMKAALELGRWTFLAPIGYINAPARVGKYRASGSSGARTPGTRSSQMTLREGDAGTALQIALESHGAFLIRELDDQIDFPRPAGCGVATTAGIMRSEPQCNVRCQTGVVARREVHALEDIDR